GGAGGAAGPLCPGSGFFGAGAAAGDGEAGGHFLREGDRSGIGGFQTARRPPGPGGWSLRPEGGGASDPFRRSDSGGRGRRGQDPGRGGEADRGMGADLQPSGLRRSAAGKGGRKGFARGAPDGGRRGRNRALSPSVPPGRPGEAVGGGGEPAVDRTGRPRRRDRPDVDVARPVRVFLSPGPFLP